MGFRGSFVPFVVLFLSPCALLHAFSFRGVSVTSLLNGHGLFGAHDDEIERTFVPLHIPPSTTPISSHLCIDLMQDVLSSYATNQTALGLTTAPVHEEEERRQAEDYCQRYPKDVEECQRLYGLRNTAYVLLKYDIDIPAICQVIGLDNTKDVTPPNAAQSLDCQACEFIAHYVKAMVLPPQSSLPAQSLPLPTTDGSVALAAGERMCTLLRGTEPSICSVLTAKLPGIINQYQHLSSEAEVTPLSSCIQMEICPLPVMSISSVSSISSTKEDEGLSPINNNMKTVSNVTTPQGCALCKNVVTIIEKSLEKDEETYEMISDAISMMCSFMPADSRCHVFVDQLEQIVQWIKSGSLPSKICMRLHFCDVSYLEASSPYDLYDSKTLMTKDMNTLTSGFTSNQMSCILCEYVADAVQVSVRYDRTALPSIKEGIQNLCQYLPVFFDCTEIYNDFDTIVDLLDQNKEPKEVCYDIKMCSSKDSLMIAQFLQRKDSFLGLPMVLAKAMKKRE